MGSDSDWPALKPAAEVCAEFGVPCEVRVVSAHRTPEEMVRYAKTAEGRGLRVIIAGAGGAAHLPGMVAPTAVMVNLLGDLKAVGRPVGIEQALAVRGAHVHIYGKAMSGAGRKMGHVTALGATMDEALAIAQRAAAQIRFGELS